MTKPQPKPEPNPDWRYSPPKEGRDGKSVWVDFTHYSGICELYDAFKVPKLPGDGR